MRHRALLAAVLALATAAVGLTGTGASAAGHRAARAPLTNLAHLDFLGDTVTPPQQAGHTTYGLDTDPSVGVLWTYADRQADGTYKRLGGGKLDPATNTFEQGAFNADDLARAAVVYLRHWRQTRDSTSRDHARELLRGLTYLQTATGANAGNVVLWMQPDGTLNPSAFPVELPDPSDSDASYWLARTVWALGEGYADFRRADPAFAGFLRERMDLAVAALDRQVLDAYGTFQVIDGVRTPAWLIADGGDATSEAMLGLSAYVDAGGGPAARTALRRFAEGVAALGGGDRRTWPFGAVRPWALSLSQWHAWGSQLPAGLSRAAIALHDNAFAAPAAADSATFTPWLLTSGGFDNGRQPTRSDRTQIAYGADSRVESLLATADATHRSGLRTLAGIAAAWFFGANPAGAQAYDPATGRTIDGINGDGVVNANSGAESTIHGLLAMLHLDADPALADLAHVSAVREQVGSTTLEAEDAALTGGAHAVALDDRWTGEALYNGTGYAALPDGGSATFAVADVGPALALPVVNLQPGSTAVTTFGDLGSVRPGAIGPQGSSPAPGALLPVTLPRTLPGGATSLTATATGGEAVLDALMLEPLLSRYVLAGAGHGTALVRSAAGTSRRTSVMVPGSGPATVEVYDDAGRRVTRSSAGRQASVSVRVLPGGFTLVLR